VNAHPETPWGEDNRRELFEAAVRERRGGDAYGALVAAQRLLQDRVAGAVLPPEEVDALTKQLRDLAEHLAQFQASEAERWDGWRPDLPGRALLLLPPYVIESVEPDSLSGRVTFTRFYLGGGHAAHGGSHTLLFDDVMGNLAGRQGGVTRTAYLTVNYRKITPIDVELRFDVTLDKLEGRKRFLSARLRNPAGEVVADADGLFLLLLPGQQ
jgi:hypothetical protein